MLDTPNDIVHWTRTNLFDILFQDKNYYWVFVMWIKSTKMKVNNHQIFHHYRAKIVYECKNKNPISFILDHLKFYFKASWKNVHGHKVFCDKNTYDFMVKVFWWYL